MLRYVEDFEIGEECPLASTEDEDQPCKGHLRFTPTEDCLCHIAAPCKGCTEATLVCDVCGWEAEDLEDAPC